MNKPDCFAEICNGTALKIIRKKEMIKPAKKLDSIYKETEELVAIIAKSISTASRNKNIIKKIEHR